MDQTLVQPTLLRQPTENPQPTDLALPKLQVLKQKKGYYERGLDILRGFECPEPDDFWEARKQDCIDPPLKRLSYEMIKLSLEDLLGPIYRKLSDPSDQKELIDNRRSAYFWIFYDYRKFRAELPLETCCDALGWNHEFVRNTTKRVLSDFTQAIDSGLLSKNQSRELARSLIRDVLNNEQRKQGGRSQVNPPRLLNRGL